MRVGGSEVRDHLIAYCEAGDRTVAEKREWMRPVLERMCLGSDPPSAIMTDFDPQTELAYFLLQELGLEVPRDISLIGFGGTWRDGAMRDRLTAITVDEAELGRRAVRLLCEMRSGERPLDDSEEFIMSLGLAMGGTLVPVPKRCPEPLGAGEGLGKS